MELDTKRGYSVLLDLLARIINANQGYSINAITNGDRLYDAHCLANKLIEHASSVLYLSHGTHVADIPSFKFNFIDSSSIDILTRATFEAFLVFHYVFFSPMTKDDKVLRYLSYNAAGIAERQGFPASTQEHKEKLAKERILLDTLYSDLKSNKSFQILPNNQKKKVLTGRWRLHHWDEIARDAGFGNMLANMCLLNTSSNLINLLKLISLSYDLI